MLYLTILGLLIMALGFTIGVFIFVGAFTCYDLQMKADRVASALLVIGGSILIVSLLIQVSL